VPTLERPLERFSVAALRDTVTTFRDTMFAHQAAINRLNVYPVPDGDTGTNMARTLDAVVTEMDAAADGLDPTCDAISHGSLMGARGNSGVILSQVMRGIATTLKGRTTFAMSGEVGPARRIPLPSLKPADVLFWGAHGARSRPAEVDHTGIYLGNGWFIHSSGYGVALAPLEGWYKQRFAWARRPLAEAGLG
jgi:hypothetical protein